jgi:hypothetical protein
MDRGRVGEDRGSKETDGCPLTVALKSYACKCVDVKQLQGEERQVVIVSLPGPVVSLSRECIWLTHASAWLVVKFEVEARQVE